MIRPIVVNRAATETMRWNDVKGRDSHATTLRRGWKATGDFCSPVSGPSSPASGAWAALRFRSRDSRPLICTNPYRAAARTAAAKASPRSA